jgi:hypothetical protein
MDANVVHDVNVLRMLRLLLRVGLLDQSLLAVAAI